MYAGLINICWMQVSSLGLVVACIAAFLPWRVASSKSEASCSSRLKLYSDLQETPDQTSLLQVKKEVTAGHERLTNVDYDDEWDDLQSTFVSPQHNTKADAGLEQDHKDIHENWLAKVAMHEDSDFHKRLSRFGLYSSVIASETLEATDACQDDTRQWCRKELGIYQILSRHAEAVVSTYSEDLSWLRHVDDLKVHIYVHNRSSEFTHSIPSTSLDEAARSQDELVSWNGHRHKPIHFVDIPNTGDEAKAYLSFILERYNTLPDRVFFVHGHRCAWHSRLNMDTTINEIGRCIQRGTFDNASYINLNTGKADECYDLVDTNSTGDDEADDRVAHVKAMWSSIMEKPLPNRYCMDCCAQFVVSRDAILAHNKTFYKNLLDAVEEGKTSLEYFWRSIFLQDYSYLEPLPETDEEKLWASYLEPATQTLVLPDAYQYLTSFSSAITNRIR